MNMVLILITVFTILFLLLAVIFTAGVVWRVEMKLDTSYKLFLVGVICLLAAEFLGVLLQDSLPSLLAVKVLRLFFAACFLAGVLTMRGIVRTLDGEVKE